MNNIFDRFPLINSDFESASVPNMFWIGANSQGRRFKQDTAGFIHVFRYLSKVTLILLEARDFGKPLELPLPARADEMTATFLDRMNRSSALFQMQSTLCDVCTFTKGGAQAAYIKSVPLSYAMERLEAKIAPFDAEVVVIGILKYGNRGDVDAFRYKLEATPEHPEKSVFLHPYFETYVDGRMVRSLHLLENLENEFKTQAYHIGPLREYFERAVAPEPAARFIEDDEPQLQMAEAGAKLKSRL